MTDYDYLASRNDIINEAFGIVQVKKDGQPLTAAQLAEGVQSMNLLVKSWTNKHLFLWKQEIDTFSTVIGTETYTTPDIDAAVIGLDKAYVVYGDDDLELDVITWSRYQDIVTKEARTGRPQYIAFRNVPLAPSVYVWPSPDAVYTVKGFFIMPLKDFEDANASGDVNAQFQLALAYGLAELLHSKYPDEAGKMDRVARMADRFFMEAKRGDRQIQTDERVESLFSVRKCR